MNPTRLFLLACALAIPLSVSAQWQWIDGSGRKVFSDQPPPANIPEKNILKQPGPRPAASVVQVQPAASAPAAAKPAGAVPKLSGKDKELEARKKQAEAAEAEKKKVEEQKLAEARADNCKRAKQSKAVFDSGVRVATADEKGERRFMDDKERAAETKRIEGIIARDCGPMQAQAQ